MGGGSGERGAGSREEKEKEGEDRRIVRSMNFPISYTALIREFCHHSMYNSFSSPA